MCYAWINYYQLFVIRRSETSAIKPDLLDERQSLTAVVVALFVGVGTVISAVSFVDLCAVLDLTAATAARIESRVVIVEKTFVRFIYYNNFSFGTVRSSSWFIRDRAFAIGNLLNRIFVIFLQNRRFPWRFVLKNDQEAAKILVVGCSSRRRLQPNSIRCLAYKIVH